MPNKSGHVQSCMCDQCWPVAPSAMATGMPFNLCSFSVETIPTSKVFYVIEDHYKAAMVHYATEAEAQQAIRLHENAGALLDALEALDPLYPLRTDCNERKCGTCSTCVARSIIRKIKKG